MAIPQCWGAVGPRWKSCSCEPGLFKTPSRPATRKIIQQATGPYILIIAGSCRCYCGLHLAGELVELRRQGSSNFVGASSLLRLHRAVAIVASMVMFVPSDSHPPPGRRKGQGRAQWRRPSPPGPHTSLRGKRGRPGKCRCIFFPLMNGLLVRIIQAKSR